MEQHNDYINDLIVGYLSGDIDSTSIQELEEWITASDENSNYFHQQEELWASAITPASIARFNPRIAYERFLRRCSAALYRQRCVSRYLLRGWMKYAAIFILVSLVGGMAYFVGQHRVERNFASIVVETPMGARSYTVLPDGTKVFLNAGTKLSYSQGYGIKDREVQLSGEGYFEVTHNPNLPFTVSSSSCRVKVLGTKFNFTDYANDEETTVILDKGSVSVDNLINPSCGFMLKPGQKTVINKITGKYSIVSNDNKVSRQWTTGTLSFRNEPLFNIVRRLERAYDMKLTIASDRLYTTRFYGEFNSTQQSINEVLDLLSSTRKFKYRIKGNHIILYQTIH